MERSGKPGWNPESGTLCPDPLPWNPLPAPKWAWELGLCQIQSLTGNKKRHNYTSLVFLTPFAGEGRADQKGSNLPLWHLALYTSKVYFWPQQAPECDGHGSQRWCTLIWPWDACPMPWAACSLQAGKPRPEILLLNPRERRSLEVGLNFIPSLWGFLGKWYLILSMYIKKKDRVLHQFSRKQSFFLHLKKDNKAIQSRN